MAQFKIAVIVKSNDIVKGAFERSFNAPQPAGSGTRHVTDNAVVVWVIPTVQAFSIVTTDAVEGVSDTVTLLQHLVYVTLAHGGFAMDECYVKTVVTICVGGRRHRGPFKYVEDSAKNSKFHPGSNGLLNAMIRYGDPKKRLEGWSKEDWDHARDHLDQKLMNKYGYSHPAWP